VESTVGDQKNCITGQVAPEGAAQAVRTDRESSRALAAVKVVVRDVVAVSPAVTVPVVVLSVIVSAITAAFADGPVERTPMPSATTTASAMRLKLVLLDI